MTIDYLSSHPAVISTVCSAITAILLNWWFAKKTERRKANIELIRAFTTELSKFYPAELGRDKMNTNEIDFYIRGKIGALQTAISIFSLSLDKAESHELYKVWTEFYSDSESNTQFYMLYTGEEGRKRLITNIDNILEIAGYKNYYSNEINNDLDNYNWILH